MRSLLGLLTILGLLCTSAWGADAKAGQKVFMDECKDCHGINGAPSAKLQKNLKITMKDLRSADVQGLSDADLKKKSIDGVGKMDPVKGLSASDIENVVAFVRTLKKK